MSNFYIQCSRICFYDISGHIHMWCFDNLKRIEGTHYRCKLIGRNKTTYDTDYDTEEIANALRKEGWTGEITFIHDEEEK